MATTFPHKRLRLVFSLAVVLLMAALSFGLEFHHHKDGNTHDDCPLCIVLLQAQAASLNSRPAELPVPFVISEFTPLPGKLTVASSPIRVLVIRPPPTIH